MINTIKLSICVPSYNRSTKVVELVNNVLGHYKKDDIELVVVDNCSTDGSCEELAKISDRRFRLITRSANIGGNANVASALSYAQGEWALMCLDKDNIRPQYLDLFLTKLDTLDDIAYGQINLNATDLSQSYSWKKGFDTLINIGYACDHPSGMFVKTKLLQKSVVVDRILADNLNFPFNADIIKAHLSTLGGGMKMGLPLVYTETAEETKKVVSLTYKGGDVWFLPHNAQRNTKVFIDDVTTLDITPLQKQQIINKLYIHGLYDSTFKYRHVMANQDVCAHYGLDSTAISKRAMLRLRSEYIKNMRKDKNVKAMPFDFIRFLRVTFHWPMILILNRW